jgi:hypothetical protein
MAAAPRALSQDEDALCHLACRHLLSVPVWGSHARRTAVLAALTRAHGIAHARAAVARIATAAAIAAAERVADALEDYAAAPPERRARLRVADIVDATAVVDPRRTPLALRLAMQRARIYAAMHFLVGTRLPRREALDAALERLYERSVYEEEIDVSDIDGHNEKISHENTRVDTLLAEGSELIRACARHWRLDGKTTAFSFVAKYENARPILVCARELRKNALALLSGVKAYGNGQHANREVHFNSASAPSSPGNGACIAPRLRKRSRDSSDLDDDDHAGRLRVKRRTSDSKSRKGRASIAIRIAPDDSKRPSSDDADDDAGGEGANHIRRTVTNDELSDDNNDREHRRDVRYAVKGVVKGSQDDVLGAGRIKNDDEEGKNVDKSEQRSDGDDKGELGSEEGSEDDREGNVDAKDNAGSSKETSEDVADDLENSGAARIPESGGSGDHGVVDGKVDDDGGYRDSRTNNGSEVHKRVGRMVISPIDVPFDDVLNANELQFSDDETPRNNSGAKDVAADPRGVSSDSKSDRDRLRQRRDMYNPAENARVASPISQGDSDEDEDEGPDFVGKLRPVLRKRRRISVELSPIKSPTKVFASAYARFNPGEDEKLLHGLKKYGWGRWTPISSEYEWDHPRSGVNLKDRARTLGLQREHFPSPLHPAANAPVRRGRPPRQADANQAGGRVASRGAGSVATAGSSAQRSNRHLDTGSEDVSSFDEDDDDDEDD